jgi:hypothetical protein
MIGRGRGRASSLIFELGSAFFAEFVTAHGVSFGPLYSALHFLG